MEICNQYIDFTNKIVDIFDVMTSEDDYKNIYNLLNNPNIENAILNEFIRQTITIKRYSKNKANKRFPLMLQIIKILHSVLVRERFEEEKEWILKNTTKKYSNLFLQAVIEFRTLDLDDLKERVDKVRAFYEKRDKSVV